MFVQWLQKGSKVKVGVLRPVQQSGLYWDRSSELPLVGLEPTEVTPRRSKRQSTVTLTGLNFADDIALLSDKIEQHKAYCQEFRGSAKKLALLLMPRKPNT